MKAQIAAGILMVLAVACAEPTTPSSPSGPAPAAELSHVPMDASAKPLDIAVIGDAPYGAEALAEFPTLIGAINSDPKVREVVHVGDIKSGHTVCSDAWFEAVAQDFSLFEDPLVYAIGDNEWTDCHRPDNGPYAPLDRLAKIRQIFFSEPGSTLGGRNMGVEAEDGYPENALWVESRVTFSSYHIIGSNNGLDPWGDLDDPTARIAEVTARNAANVAWLEHAFQVAHDRSSVGIVLFYQADLWHPGDRAEGADFSEHTEFVNRLSELAADFDGPVLIVCGDSHDLRVDPGVPWFSLYGAEPRANVTQVVVDRSIEDDMDWLRLHVDPRSETVFSWEQMFVS